MLKQIVGSKCRKPTAGIQANAAMIAAAGCQVPLPANLNYMNMPTIWFLPWPMFHVRNSPAHMISIMPYRRELFFRNFADLSAESGVFANDII